MINDTSTGYWDYSSANDQVGPQWVEYGSPGAAPKPGSINVGGTTPPSTIGSGGMPVGGANPILTTVTPGTLGTPGAYNPITNTPPAQSQFTPIPFMTPGMTFQPRTQFGQQASAPLNLSQRGQTYGQMPGGPNMAQQVPAFQSVRPGGSSGFMPQFQNPFGPQPQQPPGGEIGLGDMMNDQLRNIYRPHTQQPQQYRQMGQQPTQISQQPLQQAGLPALMSNSVLRNS
jgi:hypothetical protein